MPALRRSIVLIATASVLAACGSKPPAQAPAPAQAPPQTAGPRGPNQDSINAANAEAERRRLEAANAESRRMAAAVAAARASLTTTIYFDLDQDAIRDDQRAALDKMVPVLNANPDVRIRIGGHCDDRGSDAYNIALGLRRSASAKRYLMARGVSDSRIETVSFGEQRPAVQGENEAAWSKNRRDEFEITAGGGNLRAP